MTYNDDMMRMDRRAGFMEALGLPDTVCRVDLRESLPTEKATLRETPLLDALKTGTIQDVNATIAEFPTDSKVLQQLKSSHSLLGNECLEAAVGTSDSLKKIERLQEAGAKLYMKETSAISAAARLENPALSVATLEILRKSFDEDQASPNTVNRLSGALRQAATVEAARFLCEECGVQPNRQHVASQKSVAVAKYLSAKLPAATKAASRPGQFH